MMINKVWAYFCPKKKELVDVPKASIIIPIPFSDQTLFVEKDGYKLQNCNSYFKVEGSKAFPVYFKKKEKAIEEIAAIL